MRTSTLYALSAVITIPAIAVAQAPRPDRFHQVAPQYVQPVARQVVTAKPVGTSVGSTAAPWYEQGPLQTSQSPPSEVQRTMFYASQSQASPSDSNAADFAPSLAPQPQNRQAPPNYLPPRVITQSPTTNYAAPIPSTTASPASSGNPAACCSPAPTVAPATFSAPVSPPVVTQSPVITGPTVVSPPPVRFNTTYRPVLPVAGIPADFSVGQGLYGQPKVYVDNQPVRNFFRYLLP
ncbi:MAG: hypothetical protein ACIALR_01020 [Blastopirellula sp. JB062]